MENRKACLTLVPHRVSKYIQHTTLQPWSSFHPEVMGLLARYLQMQNQVELQHVPKDRGLKFCDADPCTSDSELDDLLDSSSDSSDSSRSSNS